MAPFPPRPRGAASFDPTQGGLTQFMERFVMEPGQLERLVFATRQVAITEIGIVPGNDYQPPGTRHQGRRKHPGMFQIAVAGFYSTFDVLGLMDLYAGSVLAQSTLLPADRHVDDTTAHALLDLTNNLKTKWQGEDPGLIAGGILDYLQALSTRSPGRLLKIDPPIVYDDSNSEFRAQTNIPIEVVIVGQNIRDIRG